MPHLSTRFVSRAYSEGSAKSGGAIAARDADLHKTGKRYRGPVLSSGPVNRNRTLAVGLLSYTKSLRARSRKSTVFRVPRVV